MSGTIDKREKMRQEFGGFVADFVHALNQRFEGGWAILVEGKRDERALRELGYGGRLATVSTFSRRGARAFAPSTGVVILTDLDREGGILAARFVKALRHEGLATSLAERRRLKAASRGVFLHIENLSRFSDTVRVRNSKRNCYLFD